MNPWRLAVDRLDDINKSYHKLSDRYVYQGFPISIETKRGEKRSGVSPEGEPWETLMKNDYGYIRGTMGVDGDEVDVFIGPDEHARKVYIVRARMEHAGKWKYDEDKVFLGFLSAKAVEACFKAHYDNPKFFGGIKVMSVEEFRTKVKSAEFRGRMLKSVEEAMYERRDVCGNVFKSISGGV